MYDTSTLTGRATDDTESGSLITDTSGPFISSQHLTQHQQLAVETNDLTCPKCLFSAKTKGGLSLHFNSNKCKRLQDKRLRQAAVAPSVSEVPLFLKLQSLRSSTSIIRRIPKAARPAVAEAFCRIINDCVSANDDASWRRVLLFGYITFSLPEKSSGNNESLTTVIKSNLSATDARTRKTSTQKNPSPSDESLKRAVEQKIADGDVSGAVRILSSEDSIASVTSETLSELHAKHPADNADASYDDDPVLCDSADRITAAEVYAAIRSFPNGSAAGIDALKPQHLKDLVGNLKHESSNKLCVALASLTTLMLHGKVPANICPILYGASLTALKKKTGGIRPIAVGNTLRRIVGKIVSKREMESMGEELRPNQLGYATPGGAEAAVHAIRATLAMEHNGCIIMFKADYENAFNTIRRDEMLREVRTALPQYWNFISQMYRQPSHLFFGNHLLQSSSGVQQGDPLGPLLFCLTIQKLIKKLKSPVNVWYLDDGTIVGDASTVAADIQLLRTESHKIGLKLNETKCEIFATGGTEEERASAVDFVRTALPSVSTPKRSDLVLLGSPLLDEAVPAEVRRKTKQAKLLANRLKILSAHHAFYLLKNCLSMPKLLYILRSSCAWRFPNELREFDDVVRNALSTITNVALSDDAWIQASFPVRYGGIGLRRTSELALPAYLASVHAVSKLILNISSGIQLDDIITEPIALWSSSFESELPSSSVRCKQQEWERDLLETKLQLMLDNSDKKNRARLLAATTKVSGYWLNTLPVPHLGTLLDDNSVRISIARRLGVNVCHPHDCRCGALVDPTGNHGLCCKLSAGRQSRHTAINETIRRALVQAGVNAVLEPSGLDPDPNRSLRPDGMSLAPWAKGKCLIWDVTCVDTCADSYIDETCRQSGTAATKAENKKCDKYLPLSNTYHFIPLGFETSGAWGPAAKKFVDEIGTRIMQVTGEKRSKEFLKQRISVDIQRGNAACIMGTAPATRGFEEIFYALDTREREA